MRSHVDQLDTRSRLRSVSHCENRRSDFGELVMAESEKSHRKVIIIGNVGSGKRTIANNIVGRDENRERRCRGFCTHVLPILLKQKGVE